MAFDRSSEPLHEKNVEAQLLNRRKSRRKSGQVYPLEYTRELLDFDNWDHMFLAGCCRSLTMHQFKKPPSVILDLGCGGGLWVLEAARRWKDATVYGFDIKEIQPPLSVLEFAQPEIAPRVKWVHGDFLDELPFPSDHFDFVRIVGIGMGVPEDQWPNLLEEISRVLKPGCPFEIIEEDHIFPSTSLPKSRLTVEIPDYHAQSSSSMPPSTLSSRSTSWIKLSDAWSSPGPPAERSRRTLAEKTSWKDLSTQTTTQSSSNARILPPPIRIPTIFDPRDHSRLKACWDAMLAKRFLSPQLVTVLPFYLSSVFSNVQSHPSLYIPLPRSSSARCYVDPMEEEGKSKWRESIDVDIFFDLHTSGDTAVPDMTDASSTTSSHSQRTITSSWASMHLAKAVQTILACKAALWSEWVNLHGDNTLFPPVSRTPRLKEAPRDLSEFCKISTKGEFEQAWSNWQNDMTDRIGIRNYVQAQFAWSEPAGERPDWRIWSDSHGTSSVQERRAVSLGTPDACRILRGFVCWNPT